VLHASAIRYGNGCVVMIGESGWGKSTLATMFHQHGKQILTDDCLVLLRKKGRVVAHPSYCGSRLLKDSLEYFEDFGKGVTNVSHYSSKKRLDLRCSYMQNEEGVPVIAFFLLTSPDSEKNILSLNIGLLTKSCATTELLKHSFQMEKIEMGEIASKLQMFSEFIKTCTPFYTLSYTRSYDFLPCVEKAIMAVVKKRSGNSDFENPMFVEQH